MVAEVGQAAHEPSCGQKQAGERVGVCFSSLEGRKISNSRNQTEILYFFLNFVQAFRDTSTPLLLMSCFGSLSG